MILRVILILFGVMIFINSCNSLISSVAGTHKLRTMSMQEVKSSGLGDADFVAITGAWSSGDYLFEPHRIASWPGFVQWPVLDAAQIDSLNAGQQVTVSIYAWTKRYEESCLDAENCVVKGERILKGLVRPLNKRFNKATAFSSQKYVLAEDPIFVEYNRQPLAWYWNLALMMLGALLILLVERWRAKKEKKG